MRSVSLNSDGDEIRSKIPSIVENSFSLLMTLPSSDFYTPKYSEIVAPSKERNSTKNCEKDGD